jgi:hypothetical protein
VGLPPLSEQLQVTVAFDVTVELRETEIIHLTEVDTIHFWYRNVGEGVKRWEVTEVKSWEVNFIRAWRLLGSYAVRLS